MTLLLRRRKRWTLVAAVAALGVLAGALTIAAQAEDPGDDRHGEWGPGEQAPDPVVVSAVAESELDHIVHWLAIAGGNFECSEDCNHDTDPATIFVGLQSRCLRAGPVDMAAVFGAARQPVPAALDRLHTACEMIADTLAAPPESQKDWQNAAGAIRSEISEGRSAPVRRNR